MGSTCLTRRLFIRYLFAETGTELSQQQMKRITHISNVEQLSRFTLTLYRNLRHIFAIRVHASNGSIGFLSVHQKQFSSCKTRIEKFPFMAPCLCPCLANQKNMSRGTARRGFLVKCKFGSSARNGKIVLKLL